MMRPCGCCAGVETATPRDEANPPGASAITYRVGTHTNFLESMLARLSSLDPLGRLTTRAPDDASIALLDAWATVADVLTFYQERIANEGYLRTAVERGSVLELARLVGYRARPGVAASVHLAFTVVDGFTGDLPPGTRAQSIPGAGEQPQFFETSQALSARDVWNDVRPRRTRPQAITQATNAATDAETRETLYFQGISANLKAGDALLIVLGDGLGHQVLRFVDSVDVQAADNRTEVTLQVPPLVIAPTGQAVAAVKSAVTPFIAEAGAVFAGSKIADETAQTLRALVQGLDASDGTTVAVVQLVQGVVPSLREKSDLAVKRRATRLGPWIRTLLETLDALADELSSLGVSSGQSAPSPGAPSSPGLTAPSALQQLQTMLKPLAAPASASPAGAIHLPYDPAQTFSPASKVLPQLLASFQLFEAPLLYEAWPKAETPTSDARVYVMQVRAQPFGHNAPLKSKGFVGGVSQGYEEWPPHEQTGVMSLEGSYGQITSGGWIVVDTPGGFLYAKAANPRAGLSRADYGITATTTSLKLAMPDDPTQPIDWLPNVSELSAIRQTVVYAQSQWLPLAEEPLDDDIAGDRIDLERLYDGIEAGRPIIVSGERTDVPGVTGVKGSELATVAGVTHAGSPVHTTLRLANPLAYTYEASTVTIYGNVAHATQGQTVAEVLGGGNGRQALQTFVLRQSPLTYVSTPTPAGVESTLEVRVDDVQWHEAASLVGLTPADRSFVTRTDDADRTSVTFGDGRRGARLPTGAANVRAIYRYGLGQAGNVNAGQLSQLATRPLGAKDVVNPLPATGGADRDSRDVVRRNAPLAVMALDRLVSVDDHADFARTFGGIGKAAAARLSDGRRLLVYVTIAGADDAPIAASSDLSRNLVRALHGVGDPSLPVAVGPCRRKLLVVSAGVRVQPDYRWEFVEPKVRAAVLDALGFERRELGQSAFSSEAVAAMQAVAGVAYVDLRIFDAVSESVTVAELETLGAHLALKTYVEAEAARVDPAATDPSRRILPAELVVLTPDIPDTLLLTEIGV